MNANQLLADLRAQNIEITATAGKLRIDAPKGALTPGLETQLRLHKQELLELLAPPQLPGLAPVPSITSLITHDIVVTHDIPSRWVNPEITDLYKNTPADVWAAGVELYRDGLELILFFSLAELQAATLEDTRVPLPEAAGWRGGQ